MNDLILFIVLGVIILAGWFMAMRFVYVANYKKAYRREMRKRGYSEAEIEKGLKALKP